MEWWTEVSGPRLYSLLFAESWQLGMNGLIKRNIFRLDSFPPDRRSLPGGAERVQPVTFFDVAVGLADRLGVGAASRTAARLPPLRVRDASPAERS